MTYSIQKKSLITALLSTRSRIALKSTFFPMAIALLFSLSLPFSSLADIYQYTDANGVVHFSNVDVGRGKKYKRLKERHETTPRRSAAPSRAPLSSSNVPSAYVDIINTACGRHGVDPALVHALVKVESDFNPYALSRKGAMGLMQLMPQTAVVMNVGNSFNPNENIDGGVKYLRYLIDRYEGNLSLALAAYNSGETAVKKWGTIPPYPETQNYVQRIMKIYNGNELAFRPHCTIYMGYGEDGALMLTDDPSKQKNLKRRTPKNL
jgi:soluble lytic murein transglycosylase-like protein